MQSQAKKQRVRTKLWDPKKQIGKENFTVRGDIRDTAQQLQESHRQLAINRRIFHHQHAIPLIITRVRTTAATTTVAAAVTTPAATEWREEALRGKELRG